MKRRYCLDVRPCDVKPSRLLVKAEIMFAFDKKCCQVIKNRNNWLIVRVASVEIHNQLIENNVIQLLKTLDKKKTLYRSYSDI